MAFWSSQRIEKNLRLLTDDPDPDMIDCNALTLRVGDEIYTTPGLDQPAPHLHTKTQLQPDQSFPIPPGRFAFLVTKETITIPKDVMGFISIKVTYKLKGLVNVSGFHVDPGWKGTLIFTVFNAGPATIHLQQGLPLFLLWIADLDEETVKYRTKPSEKGIPPAIINSITGVADSIYAVERRMSEEVKAVAAKQDEFRNQVAEVKERQGKVLLYLGIASIVATAIMTVSLKIIADRLFPIAPPSPATVAAPVSAVAPKTETPAPPLPTKANKDAPAAQKSG
jgi:dCTP deaminase